jgi:hypothetical protein
LAALSCFSEVLLWVMEQLQLALAEEWVMEQLQLALAAEWVMDQLALAEEIVQ